MLIDTHTHLDDARYNDDREAMIARAREAGVEAFLTIGCDLAQTLHILLQHPLSSSEMLPCQSLQVDASE